jgi:hypothetical protein
MNKNMRRILTMGLVLWWLAGSVGSAAPPTTPYNPKPAEGDLVLSMPEGAEMVFRRIVVPGSSFWGGSERVVQLGDGEGGIFEGLQRVQVSGSFPGESEDSWVYYVGKYEVTKGQFAAVMGFDGLLEASGDSAENAKLQSLSGKELEKALAKPLVFVSWYSIQAFIHRYNLWLFDESHPERLGLPICPKFEVLTVLSGCRRRSNGSMPLEADTRRSRTAASKTGSPSLRNNWSSTRGFSKTQNIG